MSNTVQWSLIVGVLLPPLIAVLQRPTFPKHLRSAIMIVMCVVGGLVALALEGKLGISAKAIVVNLLVVIGAAVTFYQHVWTPLKITPKIEQATSPKPKG